MLTNATSKPTTGDGPRTLVDYWDACTWLPRFDRPMPSPLAPQILRLTGVESSTVRLRVPELGSVPLIRGYVGDALMRLSLWQDQGVLPWASLFWVARHMQLVHYSHHPITWRLAKKGRMLIASLAEYELIEATVSAAPTADDPTHYREMDLTARLAELAA